MLRNIIDIFSWNLNITYKLKLIVIYKTFSYIFTYYTLQGNKLKLKLNIVFLSVPI